MSDARADILARIRSASDPAGTRTPADATKRNPIPARARGEPAVLVERFVAMATEAAATVARVASHADVPEAVSGYLTDAGLPLALVMSPDTALDEVPWLARPELTIRRGRAEASDEVAVTPTFAGIAETGSLMVRSGPATPNSLHFLPDAHIALLRREAIVGAYEDGWARLTQQSNALPRSVTLITGPSRSSDIERTVQIGVHGPRRLHIVLIDGQGS